MDENKDLWRGLGWIADLPDVRDYNVRDDGGEVRDCASIDAREG